MTDTATLDHDTTARQEVVTHDHAPETLRDKLLRSVEVLDTMNRIRTDLFRADSFVNTAGVSTGRLNGFRLDEVDRLRVKDIAALAEKVSKNAANLAENIRSHARTE